MADSRDHYNTVARGKFLVAKRRRGGDIASPVNSLHFLVFSKNQIILKALLLVVVKDIQ